MSNNVTGVVSRTYEKDFGDGTMSYSFKLQGSEQWYRLGKKPNPLVVQGAFIAFQTVQKGNNLMVNSVVAAAGSSNKAEAGLAGNAAAGGFGASRDASIHYQSSRKDALALVTLALANGAVSLGKTEAKKLALLEAMVDKFTAAYYNDIATLGAVKRLSEKAAAAEEAGDEATPFDDEE
jgi:hypothetical protein